MLIHYSRFRVHSWSHIPTQIITMMMIAVIYFYNVS